MKASELRKNLHTQIDHLDENGLEYIYTLFQDYAGKSKDISLTQTQKDLIDERLEDYEKNPENIISWEESNQLLKKYL